MKGEIECTQCARVSLVSLNSGGVWLVSVAVTSNRLDAG